MKPSDAHLINDLALDRTLAAARRRRDKRRLKHGLAVCVPLVAVALLTFDYFTAHGPGNLALSPDGGADGAGKPIWAASEERPAYSDEELLLALAAPEAPIWAGPDGHPSASDDQLLRVLAH